jgi:hypothetical protein
MVQIRLPPAVSPSHRGPADAVGQSRGSGAGLIKGAMAVGATIMTGTTTTFELSRWILSRRLAGAI